MIKVPRCYDSHLHLLPTGEMNLILNLRGVSDLSSLKIPETARRGRWLIGFGWETRPTIDGFKDDFVAFSRVDGHALLLNEAALRELGFWKKKSDWPSDQVDFVEFDRDEWPTGLVFDRVLEKAFQRIPKMTEAQMRTAALSAISEFRLQGFTHLREMMADRQTWNVLQQLDEQKDLRAYLEVNFHCPTLSALSATIADFQEACRHKSVRLRPAGIKFFVDGAMGSEGALLTEPYQGKFNHGFQLWDEAELEEAFAKSWQAGIPVAVHTIGDRAANLALTVAQKLRKKKIEGLLNLEHLQMLNPADIALFKDLSVNCHFQPSHFLSDQSWITEKLGERAKWVFPWKTLEAYGYPFFFGSDSPIEKPSMKKTKDGLVALEKSGRKAMEMDWTYPHSHPDSSFGRKCFSEVDPDGNLLAVILDGERII